MEQNNAKKQFKAYKEMLKDNIYDLSEKGWSFIGFVVYQHRTRDYGIMTALDDDFHAEEWA